MKLRNADCGLRTLRLRNADCGLRINKAAAGFTVSAFNLLFFNPHSAFRIPQSDESAIRNPQSI